MARFAHRETGHARFVSGGRRRAQLRRQRPHRCARGSFEQIWVQPAAGDAGGALGVALASGIGTSSKPRHQSRGERRRGSGRRRRRVAPAVPRYADGMSGSFLGPRFTRRARFEAFSTGTATSRGASSARRSPTRSPRCWPRNRSIGLLQGRMEFGPRALGGRSIIGDPRSPRMQSVMNLKIKFRESFRPFAPSVLREHVARLVRARRRQPLHAARRRRAARRGGCRCPTTAGALWGIEKLNVPRSTIPAITHVDYSARIQTVRRETNPFYYDIIDAFYRRTGCPVIVNTSFNVRGEPIVCTPEDAVRCFQRTRHGRPRARELPARQRPTQAPMPQSTNPGEGIRARLVQPTRP